MPARPAALVIAPEAPYPPIGGGPLRSASLIEYLSRKYDVDLIVFREPGAPDPLEAVPRDRIRNAHVVNLKTHKKTRLARLLRNASRAARGAPPLNDRFAGYELGARKGIYALGVIEHFWCAEYIDHVNCGAIWLDLHNIESVLYRSMGLGAMLFAAGAEKLERLLLPRFTGVLVTSEADAKRIGRLARTVVYPNAIPHVPLPAVVKRREIVFSGNLEYGPNRQAVHYFRKVIWPLLNVPGLRWRVIGRNPHAVAGILGNDPRIDLAGPVEDSIHEIARAQVSVAPLLAGSGTRVKIIEAWAAGTPVVSTPLGAEGLPGRHEEHLLIAADPAAFAKAIVKVLESEAVAMKLATAARALYERDLTWDAAWKTLSRVGL